MTKVISKINKYYNPILLVWVFLVALSVGAILYVVLVNITVISAVEKDSLENKIAEVEARLSETEFDYITERSKVSRELAYEYGFVDVKDPQYVTRGKVQSLTFLSSLE